MNIEWIKDSAQGQWQSILPSLGANPACLINKHGPCPFCGGKDRFRFDDDQGSGSFICSQCGSGDGMTFASRILQLENSRDLPKVIEAVANALGVDSQPKTQKSRPAAAKPTPTNQAKALAMWEECMLDSGHISAYFAGRAIVTPIDPDCIRYHSKTNAMVALVMNAAGEATAIHRTFFGDDVPNGKRKMMLGPVKNCAVHLGDHLAGEGKMAIGEGIETCLSFQQASNIPTWAGMTEGGLRDILLPDKRPTTVYILADVDEIKVIHGRETRVGQEAARRVAQRIANMDIETFIVWPGHPEGEKIDFNDLLKHDITGSLIRKCLDDAEQVESNAPYPVNDESEKPVISIVGGNLPEIIQQAETALLAVRDNEIFQRAGSIVRVAKLPKTEVKRNGVRRDAGSLLILPVDQAWIELRLTICARFEKYDGRRSSWVRIDCPNTVSRALLANSGGWRLDALAGVIETPTLRPDGSILDQKGFDAQSGLFLDTSGVEYPPIKENPTRDDAINALQFLESVLEEFPFLEPHHKSSALAAILTALVRRSLRTAPMFVFTAPKMGAGKSLLANVVALIATGRTAPAITHCKDPEEEKKSLFTVLVGGDAIALIDNVENSLGSPSICSILSEETYKARVLGETREIVVPTSVTWMATGNNLTIRGDLTTRVIMIRIDPSVEKPEERTFKRDLKTWIPRNRADLVCAGLTVLRAYAVAGRPSTGLPPFGRFEEWASVVRDALVWCGMADPCLSRNDVEDSDPIRSQLSHFLSAWYASGAHTDVKVYEMVDRARFLAAPPVEWQMQDKHVPDATFLDAIIDVAGDTKGNVNKKTLGWYLKKHRGRIEGGFKILDIPKKDRTGVELWTVKQIDDVKTAGLYGFCRVVPLPHSEKCHNSHNTHDAPAYMDSTYSEVKVPYKSQQTLHPECSDPECQKPGTIYEETF